ncbi:GNAT family N-acetyltransferase [Roseomonas marmotae]|nr:GNAT family N-acetyltransferase [Roseomonas marmotae]
MIIRSLPPGARAPLGPLLDAYAAEMRGVLTGDAALAPGAALAMLEQDARTEVLCAFEGEEPMGFALFFDLPEVVFARRCGQLDDLFVRREARGKGIARRMIGEITALGRARGWTHLRWFVPPEDHAALALYQRIAEEPGWRSFILRLDPAASL